MQHPIHNWPNRHKTVHRHIDVVKCEHMLVANMIFLNMKTCFITHTHVASNLQQKYA